MARGKTKKGQHWNREGGVLSRVKGTPSETRGKAKGVGFLDSLLTKCHGEEHS